MDIATVLGALGFIFIIVIAVAAFALRGLKDQKVIEQQAQTGTTEERAEALLELLDWAKSWPHRADKYNAWRADLQRTVNTHAAKLTQIGRETYRNSINGSPRYRKHNITVE